MAVRRSKKKATRRKKAAGGRTSRRGRDLGNARGSKADRERLSKDAREKNARGRGFGNGAGKASRRTPANVAKFCEKMEETGSPAQAAAACGVRRSTVWAWRGVDEEFKAAWDSAEEAYVDRLEEEAGRRAEKGVRKPVYQKGARVGYVQEYSDGLMTTLLRGRRPHRYRDGRREPDTTSSGVLRVGGTRDEGGWVREHGAR